MRSTVFAGIWASTRGSPRGLRSMKTVGRWPVPRVLSHRGRKRRTASKAENWERGASSARVMGPLLRVTPVVPSAGVPPDAQAADKPTLRAITKNRKRCMVSSLEKGVNNGSDGPSPLRQIVRHHGHVQVLFQ